MERGKLIINQDSDSGRFYVRLELNHDGAIWLTKYELADLFNVYPIKIAEYIDKIFKDKELFEEQVIMVSNTKGKNGKYIEYYNLDMIIALSFRLRGAVCRLFREWVSEQVKRPANEPFYANVYIRLKNNKSNNSLN